MPSNTTQQVDLKSIDDDLEKTDLRTNSEMVVKRFKIDELTQDIGELPMLAAVAEGSTLDKGEETGSRKDKKRDQFFI